MLRRYRIDITEHYNPLPEKGKYWVVHGKIKNDSIITEGKTIPEVYQNLSDALGAMAASYEKEERSKP